LINLLKNKHYLCNAPIGKAPDPHAGSNILISARDWAILTFSSSFKEFEYYYLNRN